MIQLFNWTHPNGNRIRGWEFICHGHTQTGITHMQKLLLICRFMETTLPFIFVQRHLYVEYPLKCSRFMEIDLGFIFENTTVKM